MIRLLRSQKNKSTICIAISFVFYSLSLHAQLYDVSRYADDSGLPSRIVRDVIQDHNGFLWVAGNNGLYKFDGQKFSPYYSSLKDSTGLRDNKINALLETKDGKIWIGTPRGLHVLEHDKISYFKLKENPNEDEDYIKSLIKDANDNLWISTYGGLFIVDKQRDQALFESHPDIGKIPKKNISGLSINKNGRVWVTTDSNVYVSSRNDQFVFKKLQLNFGTGLKDSDVYLFKIIDYNDSFMVAESNKGLLKATLINDTDLHLSLFLDENNKPTAQEHIYRVLIDHENNLWTATWKNKFKKYKVINENLIEQKVIGTKGGMLDMSGNAMSIYEDTQNNIWIPNTNGLYKLVASKNSMLTFPPSHLPDCSPYGMSIYAITEDNGGHIWVTTPVDLYRFKKTDILGGTCPTDYIHIKNEHLQLSRNLYIDSKNRLWIGAEGGLSVTQLDSNYNPGQFTCYTKAQGLPHNWSFDIFEEDPNNFWIGNYAGLVKLTLPNGKLENAKFKVYESNTTQIGSLVNSYTTELEKDKNGNLWIGTFNGLSKLLSEEKDAFFTSYVSKNKEYKTLSNNAIKQVFKDKSDRLWIGTQTGLNLYNYNTDTFLQLGRQEGLPSEYILGFKEDSKGFLWIATTNGVIKATYDDANETFINIQHFTKREGLADNITYRNALYIDTEDNVFIGSRNGLSIVINNKKEIKEHANYSLAITSLESNKKNVIGFVPITTNLNDQNKIQLSHFENSIKINYAVLDLSNPKYNRYRHKILPVNEQWIETGNTAELTYYNLTPGTYQFILEGSNNQDNWSGKPVIVNVVITPPFWSSNIAFIIYVFLLAAILRFFYLLRIRKRMRELEHKTKLEHALVNEREQLRQENTADFHDELGSKVTKISLFLTLAERSLINKKDPSEWLAKIRTNIKDLSGGFRDLLWIIDPKKDSLNDTFQRLKDYGEDIFNNGIIQFRTRGQFVNQSHFLLDPKTKKQIVMIFKEAMNNSAKYSQCRHVELIINTDEHYSSITLTDDGKGFDLKKKSKGRGLKNMVERARKINATISITSSDKGTSILLTGIPHMSDNFKAEVT